MIVVDAHCDTLMKFNGSDTYSGAAGGMDLSPEGGRHISLRGLCDGNVALQCFAVFTGPEFRNGLNLQKGLKMIDIYYRILERYKQNMLSVTSFDDFDKARETNRIGALLAIEGGEMLEGEISNLRILYKLGVRLMTITWSYRNQLADGIMEKHGQGGLSDFGIEVLQEMDRLGIVADVSHLSVKSFWDLLENSGNPVIASHSNAKKLCPNERNLDDDQLKALALKDGFVGINFFPGFLSDGNAGMPDILRHIEYIASIAGIDHVGFGSDFDGIDILPDAIRGPQQFPLIVESLLKMNYSREDVEKVCSGNFLRVLKKVVG